VGAKPHTSATHSAIETIAAHAARSSTG